MSPAKPGDKTFEELVALLNEHCNPTPSETVQRAKFHSRVRKPGETIADFVAKLRSLAEFCNFGASLNEMLRDRIVCGVNSGKLQQRLLAEKELTLVKAIDLAQGMETATKNAKALAATGGNESSEIHRITSYIPRRGTGRETGRETGRAQKFTGNCFCCGKTCHKRDGCRYKEAGTRRQVQGGKVISIPCVAAQAHKDTNVLTDRYTRWTMTSLRALMVRMNMNCSQLIPRRKLSHSQPSWKSTENWYLWKSTQVLR